MAGRIGTVSILLFLMIYWETFDQCMGDRAVLIRDRLIFVLCDQVHDYLKTGKLPGPVRKLPAKYKSVKPVSGAIKGFKIIFPGGGKSKRETGHPILDLMDMD